MQILILVHFIPSIWEHFVPPPVSFSSSPGTDPLTFRDGVEVSVIYFRAGYEPGHYYGDKEWYHLAGTKKVQQALSSATALRRFIEDEETVAQVMEIFTGLYTLDMNAEGDAAVELATR